MSIQITTSMVKQYEGNVVHLTQQKGSKLRAHVDVHQVTGTSKFIEQIGSTAARKRTTRHADTPRMDTPHARRMLVVEDYDWADLVDGEDQVRMLINPTSKYAEAAAMAMGRSIDDAIIAAAVGTAYTGEAGSTSTSYDSANMTVAITEVWPGVTSACAGLNVAKIITAGQLLGAQNIDPDEERYMAVNARQVASLMKDSKFSSNDYNAMRPLMDGKPVKFYGFNMILTERIPLNGSDDRVIYWTKRGIALGVGRDISTRIDQRPDKNYATQVFASMTVGATRLEEARVGSILCDINAGPEGTGD
jgi:hypothetical protein